MAPLAARVRGAGPSPPSRHHLQLRSVCWSSSHERHANENWSHRHPWCRGRSSASRWRLSPAMRVRGRPRATRRARPETAVPQLARIRAKR